MTDTLRLASHGPVIPVIVLQRVADAVPMARALVAGGVRVLDLTRVLAGPWCTQVLADLGADVIKVERPGSGDDTRGWGPPFLKDAEGNETPESAYYLCANRNKRSLTVDLSTEEGQAVIRRLAMRSDVLVENFKVGDMARHGLDAATLRAAHPRLVYCSITGFGQDGPYAQRAGYDFAIQGLGGLMGVTGAAEGEPQKVGVAVADLFWQRHSHTKSLMMSKEEIKREYKESEGDPHFRAQLRIQR